MELELESRAVKASVVLDPAALAGVVVPNGLAKVTLRVAVPGKTIVADVNAKSLRRTVATITAAEPGSLAAVLQGRLESGDRLPKPALRPSRRRPRPCDISDFHATDILLQPLADLRRRRRC